MGRQKVELAKTFSSYGLDVCLCDADTLWIKGAPGRCAAPLSLQQLLQHQRPAQLAFRALQATSCYMQATALPCFLKRWCGHGARLLCNYAGARLLAVCVGAHRMTHNAALPIPVPCPTDPTPYFQQFPQADILASSDQLVPSIEPGDTGLELPGAVHSALNIGGLSGVVRQPGRGHCSGTHTAGQEIHQHGGVAACDRVGTLPAARDAFMAGWQGGARWKC